jgi:hypothetical protein
MNPWKRVVFADECPQCECCEEPICTTCNLHYAGCGCPGPMQEDEYEYREHNGVLEARRISDE